LAYLVPVGYADVRPTAEAARYKQVRALCGLCGGQCRQHLSRSVACHEDGTGLLPRPRDHLAAW
jgi:hypothetical protein